MQGLLSGPYAMRSECLSEAMTVFVSAMSGLGQEGTDRTRRFSREQYEVLLRCSEKGDMKEWEEWLATHPDRDINLERAELDGVNLKGVRLEGANLKHARLRRTNLKDALLARANLGGANLSFTKLNKANLSSADLRECRLEGANLEGTNLVEARLDGAELRKIDIRGADFRGAVVSSTTLIWECQVNKYRRNIDWTNFDGVCLDIVRIGAGTKQKLQYNVRRKNWKDWYWGSKTHSLRRLGPTRVKRFLRGLKVMARLVMTSPVRCFWWVSDYGLSTGRIAVSFFMLAVLFAAVYYCWGAVDYYRRGKTENPGVVRDLFVLEDDGEELPARIVPIRAVYFSVVTMTTLGFGDMFANPRYHAGHLLLMAQVLSGYILLGALITRFAMLFTAVGPAGIFAKSKNQKKTKSQK